MDLWYKCKEGGVVQFKGLNDNVGVNENEKKNKALVLQDKSSQMAWIKIIKTASLE